MKRLTITAFVGAALAIPSAAAAQPASETMNGDLSLWQLVATIIGVIVTIVGTAVSIKINLSRRPPTPEETVARLTEIEQNLPIIRRIVLLQWLAIIVMGVVLIRVAMN